MALNPEWYHCPIFKKTINVGLCWEICFAGLAIKKEAVPEIMEYIKEHTIPIQELQEKFCAQCQFCQWDKKSKIKVQNNTNNGTMQNIIKIGCEILLKKDNSLLFGKRKNCYGEGTWALPGGHLEYGESLVACAKRELKEELGIEGRDFQLLTISENIDDRAHYIHASFLVEQWNGEIALMEPDLCYEWKFFDISELPMSLFTPHQTILKRFLSNELYALADHSIK